MKAKPILLIVTTLLIGFSLGMLTSAQLRHRKMKSIRVTASERHLKDVIYRSLDPSPEQQKKLEPLFKEFGKEGTEIQKAFRKEFDSHNSKYWTKIRQILTNDQLKILDEMSKKRWDDMRQFRPDSIRRGRGSYDGKGREGRSDRRNENRRKGRQQ